MNWIMSINRLAKAALAVVMALVAGASLAGSYIGERRADIERFENRVKAAQFLSHSTFGPTRQQIDDLAARMDELGAESAMAEWIDNQFMALPTSHHTTATSMVETQGLDPLNPNLGSKAAYKESAWWHIAVTSQDQLRQRVAWALAQIFVINERGDGFGDGGPDGSGKPTYLGVADYYDLMVEHAFGNYRDLLEDVTYHPVMGIFLSHLKNPKANPEKNTFPDENYAREVLQLFSVGIYQLNQRGKYKTDKNGNLVEIYDNETIKAFARVFTGLSWGGDNSNFYCGNSCRNLHDPMTMFDSYHDTEDKILLGGQVISGGQSGNADIDAALDNIFNHANVAPFISRLLIQRLVKSNPSSGYISRVASVFNNDGNGNRGNLAAVVKAILLDKEANNQVNFTRLRRPFGLLAEAAGTEHSRLKEPVLRYTAFLRAFDPTSDFYTGYMMIPNQYNDMNQAPYESPSVFNFYQSDYQPNGDILTYKPSKKIPNGSIYAPEFQLMTAVSANRFANQLRYDIGDAKADFGFAGSSADIVLNFASEIELAESPDALLEHLDLVLCSGAMAQSSRDMVSNIIATETDNHEDRAKGAILALLTSFDCAVTE